MTSGAVENRTIAVNLGIFTVFRRRVSTNAAETPYQKPPLGLGVLDAAFSTQMLKKYPSK